MPAAVAGVIAAAVTVARAVPSISGIRAAARAVTMNMVASTTTGRSRRARPMQHCQAVTRALLLALFALVVLSAPAGGAAFRGANGLIAFTRFSESGGGLHSIGIVRPDGTGIATIVEDGSSPAWSPDGTMLVFQRSAGRDVDLFVVSADGTGLRRINHPGHDDFLSAWSPDGKRIVFTSDRAGIEAISVRSEIYIVKADGTDRRRLTRNRVVDHSPVWSPDGRRIAFVRGGPKAGIYSVATSGKRLVRLTRNKSDTAPAWSPDGRLIAFDRESSNFGSNIFVMNRNGSNAHAIVAGETNDFMPVWSPDGTQLAFSRSGDTDDIYVMVLDGGNVTPVITDEDDTFGPDWQPVQQLSPRWSQ
jgi:Tol biopolymer transport system component